MVHVAVVFGWFWILVGLVTGTAFGLYFHKEHWLGGYSSWERRMLRLGHIAFLGTGLLNLAFGVTLRGITVDFDPRWSGVGFIAGGVTMPLVCFLAAWRKSLRRLFVVPVFCLIMAAADLLLRGLL